jgi:predicted O-methyltransferase YrrM
LRLFRRDAGRFSDAIVHERVELIVTEKGSYGIDALPPCDAVFIDGDHGRKGVENDSKLAYAAVRPGGVIIWHDYHDLGTVDVREVLHELRAEGHDIQHAEGTWIAFEYRCFDTRRRSVE